MCGITGFWTNRTEAQLMAACQQIIHRGPDDHGHYFKKTHKQQAIGLAHTRLAILDLSPLGHQPMQSPDGKVTLVYNGEIYNFLELRQQLEQDGYQFNGHSDTEVILALYQRYGMEMLRQLNGIFAFALWDDRNGALYLARDALGVKPLYYAEEAGGLLFASEMKALVPLLSEIALNQEALSRYLSFLWSPGTATAMQGVQKLAPGHALKIDRDGKQLLWAWYKLPAMRGVGLSSRGMTKTSRGITDISRISKQQAITETRDKLRQAVHQQMVADVPVGAFLSGGLDSSAIVAFAREKNPNLACFTIDLQGVVEPGTVDDLPYAKACAKHLQVPLHQITVDASTLSTQIEQMIRHMEEPVADPAALNVLLISQLARSHNIKVLLSGAGGDDLFTGYRRHTALTMDRMRQKIPAPIIKTILSLLQSANPEHTMVRRLKKWLHNNAADKQQQLLQYFSWADGDNIDSLYANPTMQTAEQSTVWQPMQEFLENLSPHCSDLQKMLALEQRFFLSDHNLNYTDKMSMAAGVEVRVPFLDLELVEFAHSLPDRFKQRGLTGKWILKQAMTGILPKQIIHRPKVGFGVPLRRWVKHELRELIGDILSPASLLSRGLFAPEQVTKLIADNEAGLVDASYTIFSLMCVELWCRQFVDKSEVEACHHERNAELESLP